MDTQMVQHQAPAPLGVLSRRTRTQSRQTQDVYDTVRLDALKVDGALAFAGHAMEGIIQLDRYRAQLSEGDPILGAMLMDIEAIAIQKVKKIQTNMFDGWS